MLKVSAATKIELSELDLNLDSLGKTAYARVLLFIVVSELFPWERFDPKRNVSFLEVVL